MAFETLVSGNLIAMDVAGVELTVSAVALLAMRLHHAGHTELAMRIGLAIDVNKPNLTLTASERGQIERTLEDCPPALTKLKDALT